MDAARGGNVANQSEAERCRDMAKTFLARGDPEKAARFFEKSLRLFPLPGVKALREKALAMAEKKSAPATPKPTPSSTQSSGSSQVEEKRRPYTPEQEDSAKKILLLSKRSYYDVLSVTRQSSEVEIKKSYRKLALRLHPDKNSAPSAEGAFKVVSAAFDTLTDSVKRREYDQVGHNSYTNSGGGSDSGQRRYNGDANFRRRGNAQPMDAEDFFNMFFQNMQQPRQQRGGTRQGEDNGVLGLLVQLLPILFVIIATLTAFSGPSFPDFRLEKPTPYFNQKYSVPVNQTFDVPIYLKTSLKDMSRHQRVRFHDHVIDQYDGILKSRCMEEVRNERRLKKKTGANLTMERPSCGKLADLRAAKKNRSRV